MKDFAKKERKREASLVISDQTDSLLITRESEREKDRRRKSNHEDIPSSKSR